MDQLDSLFIEAMALDPEQRTQFLADLEQRDPDTAGALTAKMARAKKADALFDNMFDQLPQLFEDPEKKADESEEAGEPGIPDYDLLEKIGSGGMGCVYLARHQTTGRRVALKILTDTSPDLRDRFDLEYRLLALMEHVHIAGIHDAGLTNAGEPFFTMEFIDGQIITKWCHANQLTLTDRIELFLQCCEGVQHAHQKSIVHRDLKPANILVTQQDDKPVVKIIDFGIAKDLNTTISDWAVNTRAGLFVGTLNYMSPEQLKRNSNATDTRSDIYALGVILYELITNSLPLDFSSKKDLGLDEIFQFLNHTEPVWPSRATAHDKMDRISTDLDCIVMKALAKDMDQRYPTVASLIDDLRNYLADRPISARPPGALYLARKFVRRNKGLVSATALVFIALVGGFSLATNAYLRERRALVRLQAANDFLNQVLSVSDPRRVGVNARVVDLLATAETNMEQSLADDDFEASIRLTLGSTYLGMGLYQKAEAHFQEAAQILARDADQYPQLLARAHFSLALIRGRQGDYPAAEAFLEQALERQIRELGADHRDTLRSQSWRGSLLVYRRRWQEAESLCRQTWQRQQTLLGASDPDTLRSLGALANSAYGQKKYNEALTHYQSVYQSQTDVHGSDHPETLATRNNLASCLSRLSRYTEAEHHLRETIRLRAATLGPQHDLTLNSRYFLARLLRRTGQFQQAAAEAEQLLQARSQTSGPGHANTLRALSLLAKSHRNDHPNLAADLFRHLVDEYQRTEQLDTLSAAIAMNNLGDQYIRNGNYSAALPVLESALAIKLSRLGPDHPGVRNTRENLIETRLCLTWLQGELD